MAWAKERTTASVALASLVVFAAGCIFVYLADGENWHVYVAVAIGSGFITTGCVSALWVLAGRRRFAEELLQMTELADSVVEAGLLDIHYRITETLEPFRSALRQQPSRIDLLVVHGYDWRESLWHEIEDAVTSRPVEVRVVLPSPENAVVMQEIATLFNETVGHIQHWVDIAATKYAGLEKRQHQQGSVEIEYLQSVPRYSYYRVGSMAALWVFENQKGRARDNPILLCQAGRLADFLEGDFEQTLQNIRHPESAAASGTGSDA